MAMVGAAHRPAGPQLLTLEGGLSPVDPLAADKGLFLEGLCSALGSESMAAESSFMLNYSLSMFRTLCSLYIKGWIFCTFGGLLILDISGGFFRLLEAPRVGPAPVGPFHF